MRQGNNAGPWLPIGPFRSWMLTKAVLVGGKRELARQVHRNDGAIYRWTKAMPPDALVTLSVVDECLSYFSESWTALYDEEDLIIKAPWAPKGRSEAA